MNNPKTDPIESVESTDGKIKINSISLLKQAWDIFRAQWSKVISVLVVAFLIEMVGDKSMDIITKAVGSASIMSFVFSIVLLLVEAFVSAGLIFVILKIIRGQIYAWSDVFSQTDKFWLYLKASFVVGLRVLIGLILLVIPGIYLGLKYWPVTYLVIDKDNLTVKEAMLLAAKMTENIKWQLGTFYLLLIMINIAGGLLFGIGLLVSMPVSYIAGGLLYNHLLKRTENKKTE